MEWPCYVIHIGRRLGAGIRLKNPEHLRQFLKYGLQGDWSRRIPNKPTGRDSSVYTLQDIDDAFIDSFSGYYRSRKIAPGSDRGSPAADKPDEHMAPRGPRSRGGSKGGEVLAIDCCPVSKAEQIEDVRKYLNARIELHREYVTLTLFVPLHLEAAPKGAGRPASIEGVSARGARIRHQKSLSGTEELLRVLYDELPRFALSADDAEKGAQINLKLARLIYQFTEGWGGGESARHPDQEDGGIFCVFHGAVLPSESFQISGLKPHFADLNVVSKWKPGPEIDETINFLNQFWYLAKPTVYKTGLHDLVANYLRNGSVIYTSNVGAQTSPSSNDYLRFLLIYKATIPSERGSSPQPPRDGDPENADEATRKLYLERAYKTDESFWISRIVSRLLTMGTLRLMAISDIGAINSAMEYLEDIEYELSKLESRTINERAQYSELKKLIRERLSEVWSANHSLVSRVSSNKVAFQAMKRQLEDLEITRIPGWQSYDAFINRRLVTTYERISEIADRYNDIWRVIRSRMDVIEAGTTLKLTSIARHVGFAALSAAITPVVAPIAEVWMPRFAGFVDGLGGESGQMLTAAINAMSSWGLCQLSIFVFILGMIYFFNWLLFDSRNT